MSTEIIYVKLLDEGVDVWKPVKGTQIEPGLYRINEQDVCSSESWQFKPGDIVRVEPRKEGSQISLYAVSEFLRV